VVQKTRKIEVKIPKGIDDEAHLRLAGQGEHLGGGIQAGDLYVVVHMKRHPIYERRGSDLYRKLDISVPQAALGGTIPLETLQGTEKVKIPEGTESGDVIILKNRGMPQMRGFGYGDLHLVVQVKTPKKLSKNARFLLEELGKELTESNERYK
jgi:molecular chaperone DnaJ